MQPPAQPIEKFGGEKCLQRNTQGAGVCPQAQGGPFFKVGFSFLSGSSSSHSLSVFSHEQCVHELLWDPHFQLPLDNPEPKSLYEEQHTTEFQLNLQVLGVFGFTIPLFFLSHLVGRICVHI